MSTIQSSLHELLAYDRVGSEKVDESAPESSPVECISRKNGRNGKIHESCYAVSLLDELNKRNELKSEHSTCYMVVSYLSHTKRNISPRDNLWSNASTTFGAETSRRFSAN